MKFTIPKGGKNVFLGVKLLSLETGDFETEDKELQDKLKKCKGVSEVKSKKNAKAYRKLKAKKTKSK